MGWGDQQDSRTPLQRAAIDLARRVRIYQHLRTTIAQEEMFDALRGFDELVDQGAQ